MMKHADFTDLAKYYVHRVGYSLEVLSFIKAKIEYETGGKIVVADVGAGTGKLTEDLDRLGLTGYAVEPNNAMRKEGEKLFLQKSSFKWLSGSAEVTGLPDNSVDWVLMGSSFHWADASRAREEFKRILKPGGYFTAIYNPRNILKSELHCNIEKIIYQEIPDMKRVSSGSTVSFEIMEQKLSNSFKNIIFMEAIYDEIMSKERYMNIWRSVNDIQVQAGEEGFKRILSNIEKILEGKDKIAVPYKTRAWTAQVCK